MSVSVVMEETCKVTQVPNRLHWYKRSCFGACVGSHEVEIDVKGDIQSLFTITMDTGVYNTCIAEPKGSREDLEKCLEGGHKHAPWELLLAYGKSKHELLAAGTLIEWEGRKYFPYLIGKVLKVKEVNESVWNNKFLLLKPQPKL